MNIYNQPIRALASVQWPWRGNGPDNKDFYNISVKATRIAK